MESKFKHELDKRIVTGFAALKKEILHKQVLFI